VDTLIDGEITIYNPGVKESRCILTFNSTEGNEFCGGQIKLDEYGFTFTGAPAKKKLIGVT